MKPMVIVGKEFEWRTNAAASVFEGWDVSLVAGRRWATVAPNAEAAALETLGDNGVGVRETETKRRLQPFGVHCPLFNEHAQRLLVVDAKDIKVTSASDPAATDRVLVYMMHYTCH